ncbi:YncE family protein [Sphingomonas flavalba]|uniref:YncE family protein n=1 Tax=Sphingomonas flavalba TaxID=2559804 RepID=UPI0039E0A698
MASRFHVLRRTGLALLTAGSLFAAGAASGQTAFGPLDSTSETRVSFAGAERGTPIQAGGDANVSGQGFRPGQHVTLLHGSTPLPGATLTADAEGKITGKLTIPADAVPGVHPIVVVAQAPYAATIAELKVSPTIPLSGQQNYEITRAQPVRGLYQAAYSAKNNSLFVTAAIGRPPVRDSEIVKLNADTLAVLARVTPQAAPEPKRGPAPAGSPAPASVDPRPGVFAVYGVGVDDSKDTVWVTNTRQNAVAVYRQSDLSLVKQFEPGTVPHARDIVIDQTLGKAYASPVGAPRIFVFDTAKLAIDKPVEIRSLRRGAEFSPASLSLDAAAHKLYTVSMSTSEVAVIDTRTNAVEKVLAVPGTKSPIGVAHDPVTGRIFVAAQGSDNLVVLDKDGTVIADTPIGAGALNVLFDPVKRLAYVSNRGAGTVAVTDEDGKIVANLGPAPLANHAASGKNGVVYVVDKSSGATDGGLDSVLRIRPKK